MSDNLVSDLREWRPKDVLHKPNTATEQMQAAASQIEALEAEVREMAMQYLVMAGQAQEELAEVKRLRAALNQIASEFGSIPNGHRAAEIARAALDPKL